MPAIYFIALRPHALNVFIRLNRHFQSFVTTAATATSKSQERSSAHSYPHYIQLGPAVNCTKHYYVMHLKFSQSWRQKVILIDLMLWISRNNLK
jgi:hypothetical protein